MKNVSRLSWALNRRWMTALNGHQCLQSKMFNYIQCKSKPIEFYNRKEITWRNANNVIFISSTIAVNKFLVCNKNVIKIVCIFFSPNSKKWLNKKRVIKKNYFLCYVTIIATRFCYPFRVGFFCNYLRTRQIKWMVSVYSFWNFSPKKIAWQMIAMNFHFHNTRTQCDLNLLSMSIA